MTAGGVAVLGLLSILIPMVSHGMVYVRSGGNITDSMACLHPDDFLELYRECGIKETLLVFRCHDNASKLYNQRILLDKSSLCWTLPDAGKNDSCVYKLHYHQAGIPDRTGDIRILDPVVISNITCNCSRLGEEMAVTVHFSGEESVVIWEVDGGPLPGRFRLMDNNRTLIIPGVQRDDAERSFWVWITNPVSKDFWEYWLDIRDFNERNRGVTVCIVGGLLVMAMGFIYYIKRRMLYSSSSPTLLVI